MSRTKVKPTLDTAIAHDGLSSQELGLLRRKEGDRLGDVLGSGCEQMRQIVDRRYLSGCASPLARTRDQGW